MVDVDFDITPILGNNLARLDSMRMKQLQNGKLYDAIDKLCKLASQSIQLRAPLTSCEKIINSENVLYLLWEFEDESNTSKLIGYLKVGKKHLYLFDREQVSYEGNFLCVLDFYIHWKYQRKGMGRKLFDNMLRCEHSLYNQLALDNPTVTLLAFVDKHYGLSDPIWQNTNYVVFPQLFKNVEKPVNNNAPDGWRRPQTPRRIGSNGVETTRWLGDAIPGHQAKSQSTGCHVDADQSTEGTLANRAHQAKQRKAHILSSKPLW
uniref:Alpha-tubulin N-acetyltransferase n=1 Tax=Strongyloides venezuelensis TaxID=75913 RepID=A0A0K0EXA1_STRVS